MRYLLSKIEQLLFYFLLFAIPFQTRIIFWQQNWYFNEWQSASVYGTDILILLLFVLWALNHRQTKINLGRYDYALFAFLVLSAVSIKNSSSTLLSAYNFLKVIEFSIFYFYIKSYAVRRFDLIMSLGAIIAGGVFQSVIAILQFFKQSSLGLSWLGESFLNPTMTGVASFYNTAGIKIIRAYGTTPHPNVLAAYLFLAMFAFYSAYFYCHLYQSEKSHHPKFNLFLLTSYPVILLAFFFSFARVALFLWFFTFAVRAPLVLLNKKFRKVFGEKANRAKLTKILVIGTIVVLSFSAFYWRDIISRAKISSDDEAVQLRVYYNQKSLESANWFGVGNGNFVNWLMVKDPFLPRYVYQPVHNIYLLIYSENGIL
ncbi:MAG: O-antigen ligase family protein, partial [Candidatus Paceibacterales bacterium]